MENKQAVECQNAQMGYFCFFRYFFRRGNLFFDKIIKNILTKQKSYDILNYVVTALCNNQHYSFSKVCAYGDTRKRKPFMCDKTPLIICMNPMYTECEKRTAKCPDNNRDVLLFILPFRLLAITLQ